MRQRCKEEKYVQKFPKEGSLKDNMNRSLNELFDKLGNEKGKVYAYVLTTLKNDNGNFIQTGCGPNFEGGRISLCTCKHRMRTWRDVSDWKGVWIAGFTGLSLVNDKCNHLFYLMRVSQSFHSHKEIWNSLALSIRTAKNAKVNPLGDIYEPRQDCNDEFDYTNYHAPIDKHVHAIEDQWHVDIDYKTSNEKRPALLVGDPKYSFIWSLSIIRFKSKHPRAKIWCMEDFRKELY